MNTTTQIPATQNESWGFYGTMNEQAKAAWPLAMAAISDATAEPLESRVQQLRAQVSEFIRGCFSNCHYSRVSCSGSRGFARFNAARSWACSVLVVDSPALG